MDYYAESTEGITLSGNDLRMTPNPSGYIAIYIDNDTYIEYTQQAIFYGCPSIGYQEMYYPTYYIMMSK